MNYEDSSMDGSEWDEEHDWTGGYKVASDLCRICAEVASDIIHIFGVRGTELQLVDKIHMHLPIMVTKEDLLPLNACLSCVSKLDLCNKMVLNCLEADTKLKSMFGFDTFSKKEKSEYKTVAVKLKDSPKDEMMEILKTEDECVVKKQEYEEAEEEECVMDYAAGWEAIEYVCYYCNEGVIGKTNFVLHQMSVHQNEVISCPSCELVFELQEEFEEHFKSHMGEEEEEEEEEEDGEQSSKKVDRCGDEYGKKKKYQCATCGKVFSSEFKCLHHSCTNKDREEAYFECPMCDRKFLQGSTLSTHMKRHKGIFTCRVCLEAFTNRGSLLLHRRGHSREELLGLDVLFTEDMKMKMQADGENVKCPVCEQIFPTKEKMELHFPTHTESSFPCHICGKILSKRNTLEYHLRTHTGEKPFQCRYCPSAFQSRIGLIVHERKHTGEKPFKCSDCDMAFRCRATLNQHKVIHSEERPFTCDHCGRGFRRRDTLETHVRTHTDERPYACSICGRAFRQKGDCNKHERTHGRKVTSLLTTEEPFITFSCSICGLEVNEQDDLDTHLQLHHDSEGKSTVIMVNTREMEHKNLDDVSQ